MSITHVTAHRLQRTEGADACLSLRDAELAIDENKEELLDRLKSSFLSRLARQHGSFTGGQDEDASSSPMATYLDALLKEDCTFSELSVGLMQELKKIVEEKDACLNVHFLFFLENMSDQHHIFYLFGVKQSESLAISEQLDVTPIYSIDTGPSLFGIKVDLAEWKVRKNYTYLSQLAPRSHQILADAFNELTGFGEEINKEEATDAFLQGVESYAKQLPPEQVNEYRNKVVDYCIAQDKKDEPVNVYGLSKELDGIDCEKFVKQVLPYNPAVSGDEEPQEPELMVDRRSLRRYTKFYGRDKDLSITFSTFHLNSRVIYNEEKDSLTIEGIPGGLRKQLRAHLNNE